MNPKKHPLGLAACGMLVVAATISAETASATGIKDFLKIRTSISKSFGKTIATALKSSSACHRARNGGKLDVGLDCNDVTVPAVDFTGGFAKARSKLEGVVAKIDTNPDVGPDALAEYAACPEPCRTETGVASPMASFTEVGKCLGCLAADIVQRHNAETLGMPPLPMGPSEQTCHSALSLGYAKRFSSILKARDVCQHGQDGSGNLALQPCDTSSPKDVVAKTTTQVEALVVGACTGANLAALDSCADTTVASLETCVKAQNDSSITESFDASYQLGP